MQQTSETAWKSLRNDSYQKKNIEIKNDGGVVHTRFDRESVENSCICIFIEEYSTAAFFQSQSVQKVARISAVY